MILINFLLLIMLFTPKLHAQKNQLTINDISHEVTSDKIKNATYKNYTYKLLNKNPFIPPKFNKKSGLGEIPILSPLQKFEIKELKLRGIWAEKGNEAKCLILTPENQGIIAKKNDYLGTKGSKIIDIYNDKIKLRSFYLKLNGNRVFYDHYIKLGNNSKSTKQ